MVQRLTGYLTKYHELFDSNRCSGWELEELIVNAIKSDTQAQHHVQWREAGHDDKADIRVRANGTQYNIQVKSGQVKNESLVLSGHRLGRYKGVIEEISKYLSMPSANLIAVPYRQVNDEHGRKHYYRICYVDKGVIASIKANEWEQRGKQYIQTNEYGVKFSLHPSMSWQIWWTIPLELTDASDEFVAR